MRRTLIALLALAFAPMAGAAGKPNIIFILADDLGYGDLGCYGQATLKTPRLDRMASEGMRFTQHYAGSTVCAPSRCVFLTGMHVGHGEIRANNPALLSDDTLTIPKVLGTEGYHSACIGKWGVGHPPPDDDPNRCGFDFFYGYANMWHAHNFFPADIIKNGKRIPLRNVMKREWRDNPNGAGVAEKKVDYVPDLAQKEATEFIRRNAENPFFLYYALNIPHANNEGGRTGDGMEVPDFGEFAGKDWPKEEKGFAVMIQRIDRYVGEILDLLKELQLEENTLVVFSSDNGPHQEGGHKMEFFNSNGEKRGYKRDLYEGGVRVPMIARWPGKMEAGAESDLLCGFQDWLPTLAEIAGATAPPCDGLSIAPTLLGQPDRQKKHEYLYWEFKNKRALRKGDWKAVLIGEKLELYDVSKDPSEKTDAADGHPELVKDFLKILEEAHTPPKNP